VRSVGALPVVLIVEYLGTSLYAEFLGARAVDFKRQLALPFAAADPVKETEGSGQ
jgi:hypothetical protein